ncbi:DEAD/DEAH box helicase [Limosilactobacillus mucosae]|uniref:DEAD/DEAH box helicase n=1 Tax=Limosilactobacillus mucosae TaxID=97478 RepID=UPI00242BF400|nr:DEAD/DEAH box helicase [Limosilactobacillus mucosae]
MAGVDYGKILKRLQKGDNDQLVEEIHGSLLNGYVDQDEFATVGDLGPKLLTNQAGNQIWNQLRHELQTCRSYIFAVAFVTDAMISCLKPIFKQLASHGVQGRLLTSDYLYFNQPKAFNELLKIPGLTVKIAKVDGFHQKGYIFQHDGYQTIIIGSANLTENALMRNYEWSLQVNSLNNGDITRQVSENIENEWRNAQPLTDQWIAQYQLVYQKNHQVGHAVAKMVKNGQPVIDGELIEPNQMQKDALAQIAQLRQAGHDRGLVISATGTGKTYLGAFDVRNAKPKRMLFLAHREEILRKSARSFQKVIGGPKENYGLYTGNVHEKDAKYLFATVQTLQDDAHLQAFSPTEFDYILVDEVHHAGASSYQKIMQYFKPKFYLGMTATPERNDDFSIFELFDYHVAYEIRLQQALEADMLCPFHYVGISDYQFADAKVNETIASYQNAASHHKKEVQAIEHLTSTERVHYILQQTEYYGYSGPKLHGLIFCATVQEANQLAAELTRQYHPAKALAGADSMSVRQQVVKELEDGVIEYIVTVDLFNEGIDIPCVNQVVFLRSTNSSIVYVQQLGRGLRKAQNKDYVEVLDFIGNYKNSYMIPIALTGDASYSKDSARETVEIEPTIGLSTIAFDEIAKERIYQSLRQVKLDDMRKLRMVYQNMKQRVGRVPLLADFMAADSIDPEILANKKKNYAQFLIGEKEPVEINDYENRLLTFLDAELLNGKRRHELILLDDLLNQATVTEKELKQQLKAAGCLVDGATLASMRRVLDLTFYNKKAAPSRTDYGGRPVVIFDQAARIYRLNDELRNSLKNDAWFSRLWQDGIKTGLLRAKRYQADQRFTLGEKYTRKDVMRLVNNVVNTTAQNIGGYFFNEHDGVIFVTYHKAKNISRSIQYEDQFLNDHVMHYFSKGKRRLDSPDVKKFTDGRRRLALFVKKSDADDDKTFYYLGTCRYMPGSARQEQHDGKPIVSMNLELDQPVSYTRYHSLID